MSVDHLVGRTLRGDCRSMDFIPDRAIDCVVTSTSYWAKRSYGDDEDEFGKGSLEDFIEKECVPFAREVARVLRDDGLFWWNIGDTAAGSGGAGGDHVKRGSKGPQSGLGGIPKYVGSGERAGLQQGNACLVPWRVAQAVQEAGLFLVRAPIIWDKGQIKPEDVRHVRRPRYQYEPILMLAKSMQYRYFAEGEVESGDVWHFPVYRGPRIGLAPFPIELPQRCILVSTEPGDVVLDPCHGSGQTGRAAAKNGRRWIGVDLYADDIDV